MIRRSLLFGASSLALGGCFDTPCEEENSAQKAFLDGLKSLAKPALASNNPLQVEEAARQSIILAEKVGAFTDWCGTLTRPSPPPPPAPPPAAPAGPRRPSRPSCAPQGRGLFLSALAHFSCVVFF